MIPGVEILSAEIIYIIPFWTSAVAVIALIAFEISSFVTYVGDILPGWACIILLIVGIAIFVCGVYACEWGIIDYQEIYTEYKVIISDEVNFNDFISKYEILNTEGKIYTIREH